MNTFRQQFNDILELKNEGSGFHYVYQARLLMRRAHDARQWRNLIKTPPLQWRQTLADTSFVLKELKAEGFDYNEEK